jgi:hypothetical protein
MMGRAIAGTALATNIATMSTTTVTNTIKRLTSSYLLTPTLPTGAPCAHCSEACEHGATSENTPSETV